MRNGTAAQDEARLDEAEGSRRVETLIESGAQIAGGLTATALSFLGNQYALVGVVGGVLITRAIKNLGADLQRRYLGPREQVRIGAVLAYGIDAIQREIEAGGQLRSDGFFEDAGPHRSPVEEVFEGVLLKARDAYEERKLPLLGNLLAAIALDATISPLHANYLVQVASELTYQQLVFMAVTRDASRRAKLRQQSYGSGTALERMGSNRIGLLTEVYALHGRGLVRDLTSGTWISVGNVNPGGTRLQGSGGILANAMKLPDSIPSEDRDRVVAALSDPD